MTQLTAKMQACRVDECGATPTTVNEMADYQKCAQNVALSMKAYIPVPLEYAKSHGRKSQTTKTC